jgi:hypothetical protein
MEPIGCFHGLGVAYDDRGVAYDDRGVAGDFTGQAFCLEYRQTSIFMTMALSIKDPEADRLARELAARTGETLTEAIVVALLDETRCGGVKVGTPSSSRMI